MAQRFYIITGKHIITETQVQNMKKTAICLLAASMASGMACAQSRVGTFSIIPKIGTNIANVSNSDLYVNGVGFDNKLDKKSKAGIAFGAELQYQATDIVAVSVGVGYSRQGYRYADYQYEVSSGSSHEYTEYEGISDNHHDIDYLNVPLMVKCYVARNFAVGAGVQAGFVLYNKASYETSSFKQYPDGLREYTTQTEKTELEYTSRTLNQFDLSIPVSASYEYMNVVVSATYNFGVTHIFKSPLENSHNQVLAFSVGYKFDL